MKKLLTLIFPGDRVLYKTLLLGFLNGGSEKDPQAKELTYQLSRIKKALFACGEVVDVPLQGAEQDGGMLSFLNHPAVLVFRPGQAISLKPGEHLIELPVHDWEVIERHMTNTRWAPVVADEVADAYDRIATTQTLQEPAGG